MSSLVSCSIVSYTTQRSTSYRRLFQQERVHKIKWCARCSCPQARRNQLLNYYYHGYQSNQPGSKFLPIEKKKKQLFCHYYSTCEPSDSAWRKSPPQERARNDASLLLLLLLLLNLSWPTRGQALLYRVVSWRLNQGGRGRYRGNKCRCGYAQ